MLANHTAIQTLFRKTLRNFDMLRGKRAFLSNYTSEPIFADGEGEFDDSREVVQSLCDEYRSVSLFEATINHKHHIVFFF